MSAGHDNAHSLHAVDSDAKSFVWDNSAPPALEIESGETVTLRCHDASGGQLGRDSTAPDVAAIDLGRVNPISGPVFVKGAQPGNVLAVELVELTPPAWGWTAIIPGFGLLADEFPDPWLRISEVDGHRVRFSDAITLTRPLRL